MPSDIFMKYTSGSSSTTWRKMTNTFMKYTSGTSSSAWRTATNIWAYFNAGWTRVWPLSGVFKVTSPYIATSSGSTTPLYGVDGVRRIGTTVYGKNGTWNANGWTINSYQYRWRAYSSSTISDLNLDSQTALATYSGAVSLSIPATYDRKYLSFFIQANSSGGTAYNGYAESGTEYGGIQIVRSSPSNLTYSLSSYSPQVGSQITYSSTWDETDRYAAESYRTTVYWYKNSSYSTTGGTLIGTGTTYTPTTNNTTFGTGSDIGFYIYAVETRYNSGSDYDLGLNTGVEAKVITTSTVSAGLTPPTSVSVANVTRYSNTEIKVDLSHSGGSGPYYQMYWVNSSTSPVTTSYDAASNSSNSSISDVFSPSHNYTAYFYVRSSSQNITTTFNFGSATAGTYSAYSNLSPQPFYTFTHPSGSISIPSTGTAGSTTFEVTPSISALPSPNISYEWQYFEGGAIGWVTIATGTSYTPPSNYVTLYGSQLRCYATANNGVSSSVGVESFNAAASATVSAPVTKLATPTGVAASDTRTDGINVTWNTVTGAAYYGVWYGPAPTYDSLADFGGNRNTSLIVHPTNSYLDTSMGSGVTRDYYVQAYRSGDPTGTKSEWGGPDSGTRLSASNPPTGGSVSVNPSSGTAGSTTYTASASGWSGTGTISYSYSWQYFSQSSFSWVQVATGSTFSPASNVNSLYPNYGWQVVVTASNGVSPNGTASTSVTINTPTVSIPSTPTGVTLSGSGLVGWNAVTGATSYEVLNYTDQTGSPANTNNRLGPYFTDSISGTSLQLGSAQGYAYPNNWARVQVRARNSAGVSTYSAWVPSNSTYT